MATPPPNALPRIAALCRSANGKQWTVTLEGLGDVRVSSGALLSNKRFTAACFEQLDRLFAPVRTAKWAEDIDRAMQTVLAKEE